MSRLRRLEVWSDVAANGGVRLAIVPIDRIISAGRTQDVTGEDSLELSMHRDAEAWVQVVERRVIRSHYEDDTVTEHRIERKAPERQPGGERLGTIVGRTILLDLENALLTRSEADGTTHATYVLMAMGRDLLVDRILDLAPAYFTKGTIDGASTTQPVFSIDVDSPLSALQRLAEEAKLELAIRRDGETNYLVDLVEQVGAPHGPNVLGDDPKDALSWGNNGAAIDRTADAAVAPDGTMTADTLEQTAVTGASRWLGRNPNQVVSSPANRRFRSELWVKRVSGSDPTPLVRFQFDHPEDGFPTSQDFSSLLADGEWHRISFEYLFPAGATTTMSHFLAIGWDSDGAASDVVFAVWDWQIYEILHSVPEFRYAKNLIAVERTADAVELVNKLYPFGANEGGVRANAGDHRFTIAAIEDPQQVLGERWIELAEDDVIAVDDALNGRSIYRERSGETTVGYNVVDSTRSNKRLDLEDPASGTLDVAVGDEVYFGVTPVNLLPVDLEDLHPGGDTLIFVESPSSQSSYGIVTGRAEHDDVRKASNLIVNPALRDWTGGVPDGWDAFGVVTITQDTTPSYARFGGSSLRYDTAEADRGVVTEDIAIFPTEASPYFSAFIVVWNESDDGLRFYLEWDDGGESFQSPEASTNEKNRWIMLEIAGIEIPPTATVIRLYVLANSTGSTPWWLDAAQITQSGSNVDFIEGRSGTILWQRAVRELRRRSRPAVAYEIQAVDLTAVQSAEFPHDALTIGGNLRIVDRDLSVSETLRLTRIRRDLRTGADVQLDVETFGEV